VAGKVKMRFYFKIFGREFVIIFKTRKERTFPVYGYSSRTLDNKHVLMFDYDNLSEVDIVREIKFLQENFLLSDAYLFKSSKNSYHILIPDKVTLKEAVTILRNSSVDPSHIDVPLRFGAKLWTLRLSEKNGKRPEFLYKIKSPYNIRQKSRPHLVLIKKLYPEIDINFENCDEYDTLVGANYKI